MKIFNPVTMVKLMFACILTLIMQVMPNQCERTKRSETLKPVNFTDAMTTKLPEDVVAGWTNITTDAKDNAKANANSAATTIASANVNASVIAKVKTTASVTAAISDRRVTTSPPMKVTKKKTGRLEVIDLRRLKRRPDAVIAMAVPHKTRNGRRSHDNSLAGPSPFLGDNPFVYFNKMISPDGKQETKEFEVLAPNMMIEGVQNEMNYGQESVPPAMVGLMLLNAAENALDRLSGHKPGSVKHHHKHKTPPSTALAVPPLLYMLQDILQPNFEGKALEFEPPKEPMRRRSKSPLYQFLDGALDMEMRGNEEVMDHLLEDHLELERDRELDQIRKRNGKDKFFGKKPWKDVPKKDPEDELLVSCPVVHDVHPDRNGDMVDDEVVIVDECHVI
ncbi:hypothetical protein KR018_011725 [Drosophila ironensis]|nr:hypothetical protein KR018_011725 [Drosophila ironensis]